MRVLLSCNTLRVRVSPCSSQADQAMSNFLSSRTTMLVVRRETCVFTRIYHTKYNLMICRSLIQCHNEIQARIILTRNLENHYEVQLLIFKKQKWNDSWFKPSFKTCDQVETHDWSSWLKSRFRLGKFIRFEFKKISCQTSSFAKLKWPATRNTNNAFCHALFLLGGCGHTAPVSGALNSQKHLALLPCRRLWQSS
jgi:hypothetical protein